MGVRAGASPNMYNTAFIEIVNSSSARMNIFWVYAYFDIRWEHADKTK